MPARAEQLRRAYHQLLDKYGTAYIETDMRAMYNPTRMEVIKKAGLKLIEKLNCKCPVCNAPGFSVTEAKPGILCEGCKQKKQALVLC